jgi:hypothetical protein
MITWCYERAKGRGRISKEVRASLIAACESARTRVHFLVKDTGNEELSSDEALAIIKGIETSLALVYPKVLEKFPALP